MGGEGGHVGAARKRSHRWCVSLTPNNTKTIGRMTCYCFLPPIRRDLFSGWDKKDYYALGGIALDESLHGWGRETPLYYKLWALVISLGFMFATRL